MLPEERIESANTVRSFSESSGRRRSAAGEHDGYAGRDRGREIDVDAADPASACRAIALEMAVIPNRRPGRRNACNRGAS